MSNKILKTRIIQKHDTEANWQLATNFTPLNGEIVIYDEDDNYNYKRIKIGNGTDNVNGDTGGESEHILTINEMPNHTHQLKTDIESPDYNITWPEYFEYNEGWIQGPAEETKSPPTHTTYTGGGQAHNNMPPYLTVSIWKRIS